MQQAERISLAYTAMHTRLMQTNGSISTRDFQSFQVSRHSSYKCISSQYISADRPTSIGSRVSSTRPLSTNSLRLHLLWLADDLVWSSLNDTAGLGQLGPHPHEVCVNVASGLTTFIDAPGRTLAMYHEIL